ncbi:hypothetical protein G5714_002895 [Onychostoma macrolepis]|uniref:Uncharacterized protein n=1 Tax=Onychostoma macrolepis TaxID=369639 RepID=A0A7J6D7Y4_9TELE|nr:hypothetical protein G5714_002895 [Onychostoma macrolepis]
MRAMIKALRRRVVVHEVAIKAAKEERLIPKSMLQKCRSLAREAIPKILDFMRLTSTRRRLFEQALEGPESSPVKGEAVPKPTKRKRAAATATKARKKPAKAPSPSSSSASETSQEGTEEEAVTAREKADPQPSPRTSKDPPQTPKRLLL